MEKIILLIPWFSPAYKAGGPVQSITNLVEEMKGESLGFNIICSNTDLDRVVLKNITADKWVSYNTNTNVWYSSKKNIAMSLNRQIKLDRSVTVYINGIFDWNYNLKPVLNTRGIKKIIAPRGMLQKGALEIKPFKKKVYLKLLKLSGLLNNVKWHATNEEEKNDILKYFPKNKGIVIAPNIPKKPLSSLIASKKIKDNLQLVYLSLITEKKNLHLILEGLINTGPESITLDIYGPVIDKEYWEKQCLPIITRAGNRICYKGDLNPASVQSALANYDALILLTKGENFGHAIYESFSTGRPVITSYFTPWNELKEKKAGWNIDIDNKDTIVKLLQQLMVMDNNEHQLFCEGAYRLANEYYNKSDFKNAYCKLFDLPDTK